MKSSPLPGTVLAMLDTRLEMFVAVACDPGAYACERKVVLPLLAQLEKDALYLADRNFCDGPLISHFLQKEAFFLVRHHGRSPRWRKVPGSPQRKIGKDSRGGTVYEQEIEVLLPDGSWQRLRRVTVKLVDPTRDGDRELHLLTNLPASVSASELSYYYLALEIAEARLGMEIAIDESYWRECASWPLLKFLSWVRCVASQANLRRYRKHRRSLKRPPPRRASGKRRAHVSTHRILQDR